MLPLFIVLYSVKVFVIGGIIGMFVLLPIIMRGDNSYFQHKSLHSLSISNVNNG